MNLNPDALRSRFLNFHELTTRHVANRDKVILDGGNDFVGRPRSYFSPTQWEWARRERGTSKYVNPLSSTGWEFYLYQTCIVRVDSKGVISLHLNGWTTPLTLSYICEITGLHFKHHKTNSWTNSVLCTKNQGVLLPYAEGMKFLPDMTPVAPTTLQVVKPDFTNPNIKAVRRQLREIRERYEPLARLHATTPKDVDPFEGLTTKFVEWEVLIGETEASPQTYVSLVNWCGPKAWYGWKYEPVKRLNRSLERLRKEQYKKYLKEVKE